MLTENEIFQRTRLLVGDESMRSIAEKRVILFGVGGVGSWCAESLVRSGIKKLTLVDSDKVCVSNLNRQLMATVSSIGEPKVKVLRERLLQINPHAEIEIREEIFTVETAESFCIQNYDCIIDAIDSLQDKVLLILMASKTKAAFFSSMGAALKMDPTKIHVAEFWKVQGCPLARALRTKFRKNHTLPARKFLCVYSEELLQNQGEENAIIPDGSMTFHKVKTNGTMAHITAIFGFTLAGLVLQNFTTKNKK